MNIDNKVRNLLNNYGHECTINGVSTITDTWNMKKYTLREHLRKHPHWDEEQQAIILKSEYSRDFNSGKIGEFRAWLCNEARTMATACKANKEYERTMYERSYWYSKWRKLQRTGSNEYMDLLAEGEAYTEYRESRTRQAAIEQSDDNWLFGTYVGDEFDKFIAYQNLDDVLGLMASQEQQLVNDAVRERVNGKFPDVNCVVGQKCSKVVNAICKKLGVDKWFNYNRYFAICADGFNPLKYETYTIISINILDYLTMSFGHNWASCHTIDKNNTRFNNGSNHYNGCYCSGTMSYALDRSTIILYTVDREWNGEMWKADKIRRNNFHISSDGHTIIQGRVYPDGRDGGEKGIASQFRAIMQDVIATCWDIPNNWTLKTGTSYCGSYSVSNGTHYRDYTCYNDCTISFNKESEVWSTVYIGHDPICPVCGEEHETEEYLVCDDCRCDGTDECPECGEWFYPERDSEAIHDVNRDVWYCCERCATRNGVQYIDGEEEYSSTDEYFCDDWDGCRYYDEHEAVCTEEDRHYSSIENAENDGNVEALDQYGYRVWTLEENAYEHSDGDWYTYPEEETESEVG